MPSASPARTPAAMIIDAMAALDDIPHQAHTHRAVHTPTAALQGASSEAAGFVSSRRPLFEGEA